jgi:hypothetical protein
MIAIRGFATLLFLCTAAGVAFAETMSAPDFHAKVVELYSFEPHNLGTAEMQAKSSQLDQFWSMVKADPAGSLPLLRKELENPSNSAFFSYDGSKLLLAISADRADQVLVLRSIAKADLREVQLTDYLRTVHRLAAKGLDSREAAFRILAFPDFKAFIPQHALTLGQDYALIYMLFPMEETLFVSDLATRLAAESDEHAQKSLLLALWYTVTPAGDAAIAAFAGSQKDHPEATAYANALMARKTAPGSSSASSVQSLREQRRKVMERPISDEALIEFDQITLALLAGQ